MFTPRASSAQRDYLYALLRQHEVGEFRVGLEHARIARAAGVTEPRQGILVDDWIASLTSRDASSLIDYLRDEDDGNED